MSYFDKVLQPGESVLVRGRMHWVIYLPSLLLIVAAIAGAVATRVALYGGQLEIAGYIVALVAAGFGLAGLVRAWARRLGTEFAVTDKRVIVKHGILSAHTVEMNIDKVESVDVDQSLLGRLLGYGEVGIHGVGSRWDPIPLIADPLRFRNAITTH